MLKFFHSRHWITPMKNIIQTVKGTREFYPKEMAVQNWLYAIIRQVSESFGYEEFDGPFLEFIDLFAAKSGEELVKEQAFVFPDRGGKLITLRPELTLSLARMVAQKQNELVFPLRWWSYGPFWRYERPQKGRTREFFQWNIDLIGINSPEADAELVSICAKFFQQIELKSSEVKILVNDRRLMDEELTAIGISSALKPLVLKMIDRQDKMLSTDWESYILEKGINDRQLLGLKNLLGKKDIYKKSETLNRFFLAIEELGFSEYVEFNPSVVRGLDYYTGIVFEAKDLGENGRSILGGGHYDNLVADVGGSPLPGVGFALGDVMLLLVLEKYGKLPKVNKPLAEVLVTVFDQETMVDSIRTSSKLRQDGLNVICYPEAIKLDKQIKYADRSGIRLVIMLGPDEIEKGQVTIKDLKIGEQIKVESTQTTKIIKRILADENAL